MAAKFVCICVYAEGKSGELRLILLLCDLVIKTDIETKRH